MASKAHDFIKLFNAIESVRGGLVAHPQDTRSTLSLVDSPWRSLQMFWVGWLSALITQFYHRLHSRSLEFLESRTCAV
ncbi:hypothetical protein Peur_023184 [Populus x canadensis]